MDIKYGDYRKRQINDVVRPGKADGFDVRRPSVRHQSIGQLDDGYLRSRHIGGGRRRAAFGYTHIPPLESLHSQKDKYVERLGPVFSTAKNKLNRTWLAALSLGATAFKSMSSAARPIMARLPKRYTLGQGLRTNWHTPAFNSLRLIVPAALILGGIAIMLPGQRQQPFTVKNDHTRSNSQSSPKTTPSQNNAGNSQPGGNAPSGTPASQSSAAATGTALQNGNGLSAPSSTGGSGGGSTASGGSTPAGGMGGGSGDTSGSTGGGTTIMPPSPLPALPVTVCTKPPLPDNTCVN
jgi:hypothetical protein